MVILFSLSFVERSSGQLGWGHLEGLNLELRNLKLVKLLEFEVEAFFMSNCNNKLLVLVICMCSSIFYPVVLH